MGHKDMTNRLKLARCTVSKSKNFQFPVQGGLYALRPKQFRLISQDWYLEEISKCIYDVPFKELIWDRNNL